MLSAITIVHVGAGALAVLAGAMAAVTRKGGSTHITAGRLFVALMIASSLLGAILGLIKFDDYFITFFAGILAIYLVVSGWLTASGRNGVAVVMLGALNVANFAALVTLGCIALANSGGRIFGFAGEDYLFLAGMSGVGLLFDVSLMFRNQLVGKHRIARHLWRMLLGFFIAAGSAFTGPGASAFPESLQQSGVLAGPELLIALLMLFYLGRTLLFSAKKRPV